MDLYDAYVRPDERGGRRKYKLKTHQRQREFERRFGDFECRHCRLVVSAAAEVSGVRNRNHCPYCLWSRHLDLRVPGDRLSACQGGMRPVGLAFKRRHKQYASAQPGELMLVHQCQACGHVSLNRVAADDGPARLWDVFAASLASPPALPGDVTLSGADDDPRLERQLPGALAELEPAYSTSRRPARGRAPARSDHHFAQAGVAARQR